VNVPLRRVAIAILVLFAALLINANVVQVGEAGSLQANKYNSRVLEKEYDHARGPIVAGDQAVASSTKTPNDHLKYLRVYPGGPEYAPVTGYYSIVLGATGIERTENKVLAGTDDRLFTQRLSDLFTGRTTKGGTVVLTLNRKAQDAAWKALGNRTGAVVALDPKTGAVLALASSPSYDPTKLSSHDLTAIKAYWEQLNKDPREPLLNRAIAETYPPGSVFKVVTTAAALTTGRYNPGTVLPAPDAYRLPLTNTYLHHFAGETCGSGGQITLADALRISCNTAYAELGVALGDDVIRKVAQGFGFGQSFTIPLPVAASHFPDHPNKPQTALSAIGQFDVRITPLQAAMIAAGVANGGVVMKPYLVQEVKAPDLSTIEAASPQALGRAISPQVAATLTQLMQGVVASGTGTAAQLPGISVAGKTGTAQHGANRPEDAWFICFAPANDPKVAVAVVLPDAGQTGGTVAAPIARAVMAAVLNP
jgi:peptidoglycan glycosyltransferase